MLSEGDDRIRARKYIEATWTPHYTPRMTLEARSRDPLRLLNRPLKKHRQPPNPF